ncbi:hypothetical protein Tco_1337948 [Tanacetum coccineum]
MAAAMKHMDLNFAKLDKIEGVDFRRWQKRCSFAFLMKCVCLILNGMSDSLFDIYQNVDTFKELWDTLEAKYIAEDASSKKFLVSCIIDKLPPSWKDFKHTLKHLKEELTLVELGSHLRIEESLRA